jgi:hypothetical protein
MAHDPHMSLWDRVVGGWRRRELLAYGGRARATVTAVRSLRRTSAAGRLTEIALRIDPAEGKPFRRTVRDWLPPGWEARLVVGATVPVRYDDRTVVLDTPAMGILP